MVANLLRIKDLSQSFIDRLELCGWGLLFFAEIVMNFSKEIEDPCATQLYFWSHVAALLMLAVVAVRKNTKWTWFYWYMLSVFAYGVFDELNGTACDVQWYEPPVLIGGLAIAYFNRKRG